MTTHRHRRLFVAAILGGLLYSLPILLRNWFPRLSSSFFFFLYSLSVFGLLVLLFAALLFACAMLLWERIRLGRVSDSLRQASIGLVISFVSTILVLCAAKLIERGLPTGSWLATFDSIAWCNPDAARYVKNDITIRQKMLGDVVSHVLPGHSRAQIEVRLGPSLDTAYFRQSGRDMIYALGPERDSIFVADDEWLLIWLDHDGRFERYAIYND